MFTLFCHFWCNFCCFVNVFFFGNSCCRATYIVAIYALFMWKSIFHEEKRQISCVLVRKASPSLLPLLPQHLIQYQITISSKQIISRGSLKQIKYYLNFQCKNSNKYITKDLSGNLVFIGRIVNRAETNLMFSFVHFKIIVLSSVCM